MRLEPGNRFTTQLFTAGDANWLLWNHDAHIFARSHAPLDVVWSHLRRILQFVDDRRRRQMFRFWQQDFMRYCFEALEYDDDSLDLLLGGGLLRSVFGVDPKGFGWHFTNPASLDDKDPKASRRLSQIILPLARQYGWSRFQASLVENLARRYDGKGPAMRSDDVISVSDAIRASGITKENAVADMTEAALLAKHYKQDFQMLIHAADPMLQLSEATRAKRVKIIVNESVAELRHG